MDLSQAQTSTCLVAHSSIAKLLPRQHVSALESVSLADSVPDLGKLSDVSAVEELMNHADDCAALTPGHQL